MAIPAVPTEAPFMPAAAGHETTLKDCLDYAAVSNGADTPPGYGAADAERTLASLRCLERCLNTWLLAHRQARAETGTGGPSASVTLGDLTRELATWLQAHPERASDPVEWLVPAVLTARSVDLSGR